MVVRTQNPFLATVLCLTSTGTALAQRFEFGAGGGASFYSSKTISTTGANRASATAGFSPQASFTGYIGQDMYRVIGGEVRYAFQFNGLKLSSGSSKATFAGRSQSIHYDFLWHTKPAGYAKRAYLSIGAGVKQFSGTGEERAVQPLSEFAYLTRTSQVEPLIAIGGGIKYRTGRNRLIRLDVRDYLSPFPTQVISPAQGGGLGGWVHNFVVTIGFSVLTSAE